MKSIQTNSLETAQTQSQQASILIVDDIPDNIRFLSSFLIEQGYQVRKAINGQMALKSIESLLPDLILLDINLPDINGYEICHQLKQNSLTVTIPILFLSAGNEAIDKVKAFQVGAVDYITKPFSLEEVLVRIRTQLTIQELQKKLKDQNRQLTHTLNELKVAQNDLMRQGDMMKLRKVIAEDVHEINNPFSFMACNIKSAEEYINHLLLLIKIYRHKIERSDPNIDACLKDVDLEFIASDLMKIIDSMGNDTERIRSIVLALRIFICLDKLAVKEIDLS